jgi:cytochrome c heme-lyase
MADSTKCPVDHGSLPKPGSSAECPVDNSTRSSWTSFLPSGMTSSAQPPTQPGPSALSTSRETSSIPNAKGENWVYPSEVQFFAAMARKNHGPQEADMHTIVPIHNAVNERAWHEILKWEKGRGGEACGGVKLVSFKGRPGDLSPKARWKSVLGYASRLRFNTNIV